METMNVVALVHYRERIVHTLRLRLGFVDADRVSELSQQNDQAWTVALQVGGFVHDDLDAVAAARQQELTQQLLSPDSHVRAAELTVEDSESASWTAE